MQISLKSLCCSSLIVLTSISGALRAEDDGIEAEGRLLFEKAESIDIEDEKLRQRLMYYIADSVRSYRVMKDPFGFGTPAFRSELNDVKRTQLPKPEYVENIIPIELFDAYESPAIMVQNIAQGSSIFALSGYWTGQSGGPTQTYGLKQPLLTPYSTTITWKEVRLFDGQIIPVQTNYSAPKDMPVAELQDAAFEFTPNEQSLIVHYPIFDNQSEYYDVEAVIGEYEAIVPKEYNILHADSTQFDTQLELGDHILEISQISDYVIKVTVRNVSGDPIQFMDITENRPLFNFRARDYSGNYLEGGVVEYRNGPLLSEEIPDVFEIIENALSDIGDGETFSENDFLAMTEKVGAFVEELSNGEDFASILVVFKGNVQSVEVIETISNDMEVVSGTIEAPILLEGKVGARYYRSGNYELLNPEQNVYLQGYASYGEDMLADLTEEHLQEAINVEQVINEYTYPSTNIVFEYPQTKISLFLPNERRFKAKTDLTFYNADGDVIDVDPDSGRTYEITGNVIEYDPNLFPEPPARVTGTFLIMTFPDVTPEVYGLDELPEGITVSNNQIIHLEKTETPTVVSALNQDGRYLADYISLFDQEDDNPVLTTVYYNDVAKVEVLNLGEMSVLEYQFDVEITPQDQLPLIAR